MLKSMRKSLRRGEKGFTLIELLIVIAVIGILVAVAIPSIASFIDNANLAGANSELAAVKAAAVAYVADSAPSAAYDQGVLTGYISQGTIEGTYNFTVDGDLDETNPPTYTGFNYSTTEHRFTK